MNILVQYYILVTLILYIQTGRVEINNPLVLKLSNSQRCTTEKGNRCIFPFEYKNKTYNSCSTEIVKPWSWCSISVDKNGNHQNGRRGVTWGYCSTDCPVYPDQVKEKRLCCTKTKARTHTTAQERDNCPDSQCVYKDNCP